MRSTTLTPRPRNTIPSTICRHRPLLIPILINNRRIPRIRTELRRRRQHLHLLRANRVPSRNRRRPRTRRVNINKQACVLRRCRRRNWSLVSARPFKISSGLPICKRKFSTTIFSPVCSTRWHRTRVCGRYRAHVVDACEVRRFAE